VKLRLPSPSREIPGENDRDRWERIVAESDRIPPLTAAAAYRDLKSEGLIA
jgi:hypothetical protein